MGLKTSMHGILCSRVDLTYKVSKVSRFMANHSQVHWEALKWLSRYLSSSLNGDLKDTKVDQEKDDFEGYVDANYERNLDTRISLWGYMFTFFRTTISCMIIQQPIVVLSTTQEEYIALVEGSRKPYNWKT